MRSESSAFAEPWAMAVRSSKVMGEGADCAGREWSSTNAISVPCVMSGIARVWESGRGLGMSSECSESGARVGSSLSRMC